MDLLACSRLGLLAAWLPSFPRAPTGSPSAGCGMSTWPRELGCKTTPWDASPSSTPSPSPLVAGTSLSQGGTDRLRFPLTPRCPFCSVLWWFHGRAHTLPGHSTMGSTRRSLWVQSVAVGAGKRLQGRRVKPEWVPQVPPLSSAPIRTRLLARVARLTYLFLIYFLFIYLRCI